MTAGVLMAGLGGCSGPERLSGDQYAEQLNAIAAELAVRLERALAAVRPGAEPDVAARAVLRAATAMDRTADDLASLVPPEDVERTNADLVEGIRLFAEELRTLAGFTESEEEARVQTYLRTASRGATPALVAIEEAFDELRAAGYLDG